MHCFDLFRRIQILRNFEYYGETQIKTIIHLQLDIYLFFFFHKTAFLIKQNLI